MAFKLKSTKNENADDLVKLQPMECDKVALLQTTSEAKESWSDSYVLQLQDCCTFCTVMQIYCKSSSYHKYP